ncbi:MAG: prepilin peptidase [Vicinamibacterales bacterium]
MDPLQVVTIGIAVVAAIWDLRTRRIPNVLTFGAAVLAVAVHAYTGGPSGAGWSVAGWLVGVAFFLPFFILAGMGAGDVKLLAALGAWLGPGQAAWLALFSLIAGGVLGLAVALGYGYLTQAIANIGWMFQFWRSEGPKPVPEVTLATHKGPRLAYAVPVLAGLMVTLWLH